VGTMRTGQHVTFRVDAFPTETFVGTVQQVRLQPTTVQNVVTYQTVINVPNQQFKLKPGMTANVTIEITRKTNVLRMPVAASRFRPTTEIFAALKQEPPADFGRGGAGRGRNAGGTGSGGQGGFPGGQPAGATAPTTGGVPAAAVTGAQGSGPTQQATVSPQGQQPNAQGQGQGRRQRQAEGSPAEARGGGDRMPADGSPANGSNPGGTQGGGRGGFGNGGGRGGFNPNMTDEERRKRIEERMASMTPEERAAFREKMAQRAAQGGGRGGSGGGQGQGDFGGGQGQGGGRGGPNGGPGQGTGSNPQGNANRQGATNQGPTRVGRVDSAPTTATSPTTIDSLFGPLPSVETRGQVWLYENKQLKQVRMRLGVSDGTNVEIIDANPEVKEGSEVVTNVIIETATTTPGQNNANNPLLGPQRGRGGPGGGFGGPGGGGGGGGRGGR
jgi:hypothetical protein